MFAFRGALRRSGGATAVRRPWCQQHGTGGSDGDECKGGVQRRQVVGIGRQHGRLQATGE